MTAVLVGLVLLVAVGLAINSVRGRLGWTAVPVPPQDLEDLLRPAFRWVGPEGAGPFPAAILLSGCDGPKSNLDDLAAALAESGWLALIVDSHGPRGLDRRQRWRLVCAGQILNGAERAADIAVSLAVMRRDPRVRRDRVALIGLSHGGWSILDFLALSERGTPPPLLTEWPEDLGSPPHRGVTSAVLYYPYCGLAAVGSDATLPLDLSYLFLLVRGDTIADETRCEQVVAGLRESGGDATVVYFDGVTHGFDQQEKSLLSTLTYDEPTTREATRQTVRFLEEGSSSDPG